MSETGDYELADESISRIGALLALGIGAVILHHAHEELEEESDFPEDMNVAGDYIMWILAWFFAAFGFDFIPEQEAD